VAQHTTLTHEPDMAGQVVALIPVRSLTRGKTRLAPDVGPGDRASLIRTMLGDVIGAATASGVVDRVAVISPDPTVLALAASLSPGILPLRQPDDRPGLIAALDQGRDRALAGGAATLLILFADLPLLAPGDVRAMVAADAPVVLSPDRHGAGTNALLLRLGEGAAPFRFRFGECSFGAHLDEADRLGLRAIPVVTAGTSLDVDTPADLAEWSQRAGEPAHTLASP
jgi:2-phospho-L-lactate guanylyltransferase